MVAAPWRYSTLGHSISAAGVPAAACGAAELRFSESPEKKDFTLLANEALDDAGAGVVDAGVGLVDAVDAAAGDGELSPLKPLNEEQAVKVAATTAAATAGRQTRPRAPSREMSALPSCRLRLSTLIMRNLHPQRHPYSSGTVTDQKPLGPLSGELARVGRHFNGADAADRP
ncbi:MAG TPA: hypothetical protein VLJ17_00425 [Xanthobacteraceae bacterium]|nr:hypothetical protein [Xanthobacteraceae bacterium]